MNKYVSVSVVAVLVISVSPFIVKEVKKQSNPNRIVLQCTPRGRLPSSKREDRLMVDGYAITVTLKDPGFDPQTKNWYRDYRDAETDFSVSQIQDGRCYSVAPSLIELPLDDLGRFLSTNQHRKFRQFVDSKVAAKP